MRAVVSSEAYFDLYNALSPEEQEQLCADAKPDGARVWAPLV
jgi:hypothetical protein